MSVVKRIWAYRIAAALALALIAAAQVQAQCCMYCPNGAGVNDAFDSNAHAKANPMASKGMGGGMAGTRVGLKSASGATSGAAVIVYQAAVAFNVPPVPTTTNGSLSSTLFSGIVAAWDVDNYQALSMLTFDPTHGSGGSWAIQALIQKNGQTVAAGEKQYTPGDGHQITSTISQPYATQTFMEITMADPFSGFSTASLGGFTSQADNNTWHVGWGWSDAATDCSVFPPGGSVQISNVQASNSNGEPLSLDFTNQNSLQPFCNLAAQSTYEQYQAAVTFTYDDGLH